MTEDWAPGLADGRQSPAARRIIRGTRRLLRSMGFASLCEVPLRSGRRADIVALGGKGEIWIVEVKSSLADFRADDKWPDYHLHCDRLFFATSPEVPAEIFPSDVGLIIADAFAGAFEREAPLNPLAPATRREVLLRFSRLAADRLLMLDDPGLPLAPG